MSWTSSLRLTLLLALGLLSVPAFAQTAGKATATDLVIADAGATQAIVVVAPDAGPWEQRAAADLAHFIERISGAAPRLASTAEAAVQALAGTGPVLLVGRAAVAHDGTLSAALAKVAKPNPVLRADAIALRRQGNRVLLAGTNDDSHYYAVAELLGRWGCRWYLPGELGECIPEHARLSVGELDYAYAPPFEVRRYWLSWNGDTTGKDEFMRRNFFNDASVPNGHALGGYTKDLIPPGKTMFNVPIAEPSTATHVARQVSPQFAKGQDVMLGLEDGIYQSDSPIDKELVALQYDKYFLSQSYTDAFMVFYNRVAEQLQRNAPDSKAHIGFLIYANITLPPVRPVKAAKPLVGYLAPIDLDPIHGMSSPHSAPAREYRQIFDKWAQVMDRRLVIYDYDQSMLVWRDIPNPSHQAYRDNVQHYRRAGILGVDTESRGALATTFTNLYLRGQLSWNPDCDVDGLLQEFYRRFYGPAAEPLARYWNAIFQAWNDTLVTEHEYFVAPAIYTPELLATLRNELAAARKAVPDAAASPLVARRLQVAELGFEVLDAYMAMTHAANRDVDYQAAVAAGERGLAAREKLTALDGRFTTYRVIGESGYAWWPGEVQQYRELLPYVAGPKGQLVAKTPLVWSFRRDADDQGLKQNWQQQPVDLSWWKQQPQPLLAEARRHDPGEWEQLATDQYAQAQGIVTPDFQSFTGHLWYDVTLPLTAEQVAGPLHLRFPGMFNEAWLYVNGTEAAHRKFEGVWWLNDYRFEWDVDLTGKLRAGDNRLTVRLFNPHHFGGMFRRPFLYRAAASEP